jgi:CrcB protein
VLGAAAAFVAATGAPSWVLQLVGTGVCGTLTTFSTFGYETVRLIRDGAWLFAFGYVVVSLVMGLAACVAGWGLAGQLAG